MATVNKEEVDVVGLDWAGSLISIEPAMAGLKVRALGRGGDRDYEEFAYRIRKALSAILLRNRTRTATAKASCLSLFCLFHCLHFYFQRGAAFSG